MLSETGSRVEPVVVQPREQILVVYDSQYGNTEKIAQAIARTLAQDGDARILHIDQANASALDSVRLLVMGCPTQAWHATPAMTAFLASIPREQMQMLAVACFDTRYNKPRWLTGSAARHLAKLVKRAGGQLIVPAASFFVDGSEGPLAAGETERAEGWARALSNAFAGRAARVDAL